MTKQEAHETGREYRRKGRQHFLRCEGWLKEPEGDIGATDYEIAPDIPGDIRRMLHTISIKGHKNGYDWNSDPENLTILEGKVFYLLSQINI